MQFNTRIMTEPELRELDACEWCGQKRPPNNKRFCSKICYHQATWEWKICKHCEKKFEARRQYVARGQMKYCSEKCSQDASASVSSVDYNGDTYHVIHGYHVCSSTGNRLNRVVWQEVNGPIPDGFVVHHKDENKLNNSISNLELMEWGEHSSKHNKERHARKRLIGA